MEPLTHDESFVYLCAVRYCLGRMTYAVGIVVQELLRNWDRIDCSTRAVIRRDIRECLERGCGMDIDEAEWKKILQRE